MPSPSVEDAEAYRAAFERRFPTMPVNLVHRRGVGKIGFLMVLKGEEELNRARELFPQRHFRTVPVWFRWLGDADSVRRSLATGREFP